MPLLLLSNSVLSGTAVVVVCVCVCVCVCVYLLNCT